MPSNAPAPAVVESETTSPTPNRSWLGWSLAALVALVLLAYALTRALSASEVMGSVTADQVELGGLNEDAARDAVSGLEASLGQTPAQFTVLGQTEELAPIEVGFDLDEATMVETALEVGRSGNPIGEFAWWLTHLFSSTPIPLAATIDRSALDIVLTAWDEEVIASPPFPGAVTVEGTEIVGEYPRSGQEIDRNVAPDIVLAQASTSNRTLTELPVIEKLPTLTISDIDAAVDRGSLLLAGPVTLRNPDQEKSVTFSVDQLAQALTPEVGESAVTFGFDPEIVSSYLEPIRADLEEPPVDAQLSVEGDVVTVIEGSRGTEVNPGETAASLLVAAGSASRAGVLPIDESVDPDVTTEELEALNITHKVSQFTTYHDCCQNRVENIHRFADAVDGTIVRPGETFSLNDTVGERTIEKGYLEDGAIVAGRLEKEIGGGVSQFATTFYNAVFWGGYEDVTHKPHSFYFSRYPLGIESTISWPLPDVQFRNDSDSAILIRTFYSGTSITVAFYSENDGRILVGEQSGGRLRVAPTVEGGPDARKVSTDVSEPFNFREPPPALYIGDPAIAFPNQKRDQTAAQGYTVEVTRFIEVNGQTRENHWTVVYSPRQEIILVHPCQIEGSGVSCPTTTTAAPVTTFPPATTTPPPPQP